MKNKNIIIGIHTCLKNKEKVDYIKNNFLKNLEKNFTVYFVYGDAQQTSIEGNNMLLLYKDVYEYLPVKTIEFFKTLKDYKYDAIIKMDDDIFIDTDKFTNFIYNIKNIDYAGFFHSKQTTKGSLRTYHYDKCSDVSFNKPVIEPYTYEFANGACYYLSKKAVDVILENYTTNFEYQQCLKLEKGSEDRMVGQILTFQKNINILKTGYWISLTKNTWSSFNDSILHPINFNNLPSKLSKLNKKFIFRYLNE